jgi:ketosteroid isomerase-like protein
MSSQHDEIATFLSAWATAETSGDAGALRDALADDFTAFGPLGFALSKEDWLGRQRDRALRYETFAHEELELRPYDGTVVATARPTATGTTAAAGTERSYLGSRPSTRLCSTGSCNR